MHRIKDFILKALISAKKPAWKPGQKIRVLIAVNRYFTIKQWTKVLAESLNPETNNWEIVYCQNKIDVYRHFADANISFIYGLGDFQLKSIKTPGMVYFPMLGLDFMNRINIPDNITIIQPPPLSAQSIAEYCIAMAILLTRNLHNSFENYFSGKWMQSNIIPDSIFSITKCKIGVLGLGKVGKVIVENFSKIGCQVIGCDKETQTNSSFLSSFYQADRLYDFIGNIDILIIALPLNKSTKRIIDTKAISVLGKSKYLINVSRGEIVDENALMQALSSNNLKGAALDVCQHEPLPRNSALYSTKNLILTPHIAGNINLFVDEIQRDFVLKALAYSKNPENN